MITTGGSDATKKTLVGGNPYHCRWCGQFCDSSGWCDICFRAYSEVERKREYNALRDQFGRQVREEWIAWAKEQPDVADHPSWLIPWAQLDERDREVDRRIGERLYNAGFAAAQPVPVASAESDDEAQATEPYDIEREQNPRS